MMSEPPPNSGSVLPETVARRTRTLERYAKTAATVLLAHIGFLAIVIPILTYLGSIELVTAQELRTKPSFAWALSFWLMVVGGCLYIMIDCRKRAAKAKQLLDGYDRRESLPSIEQFEDEFNTDVIAVQLTVVEAAAVLTLFYLSLATVFDSGVWRAVILFLFFVAAGGGVIWLFGQFLRGIQFAYQEGPQRIASLKNHLPKLLQQIYEKSPTDRFPPRNEQLPSANEMRNRNGERLHPVLRTEITRSDLAHRTGSSVGNIRSEARESGSR